MLNFNAFSKNFHQINNYSSYHLCFCACYQIFQFYDFVINAQAITFFYGIMRCPLLPFLGYFVWVVQSIDWDLFAVHHLNWNTCYNSLDLRNCGSDILLGGQGGWRERGQGNNGR